MCMTSVYDSFSTPGSEMNRSAAIPGHCRALRPSTYLPSTFTNYHPALCSAWECKEDHDKILSSSLARETGMHKDMTTEKFYIHIYLYPQGIIWAHRWVGKSDRIKSLKESIHLPGKKGQLTSHKLLCKGAGNCGSSAGEVELLGR